MKCKKCGAEVKEIPLTKGYVAIVPADFEGPKYYASKRGGSRDIYYAKRRAGNSGRYLHQDLFGWKSGDNKGPQGWTVDHLDNNTLNNCLCNLRKASLRNQSHGRRPCGQSKYLGVFWRKREAKWCAQIRDTSRGIDVNGRGRQVSLGYFVSECDAARAYNDAAIRIYGPGAHINIIREDEEAAE